jgi:phage terminase Nu1 subunit (DNA packaging protein)
MKKTERPRIVGIKELAVILNLTPRRVHQLVQEGLPKKSYGRYDRDQCAAFYIRYLHALVEKKAIIDEGGEVLKNERE